MGHREDEDTVPVLKQGTAKHGVWGRHKRVLMRAVRRCPVLSGSKEGGGHHQVQ